MARGYQRMLHLTAMTIEGKCQDQIYLNSVLSLVTRIPLACFDVLFSFLVQWLCRLQRLDELLIKIN